MFARLHGWLPAAALLLGAALAYRAADADAQPSGEGTKETIEIFVPRAVIYPGDAISQELLKTKAVRRDRLSGRAVLTAGDEPSGWVARRTLVPDQPIHKEALRRPTTVQQGQPVTVEYIDGSISIALNAVAIQSGGIGDTISVRNSDTGRVVRATIMQDRTLRLNAP